LIFFHGNSEDIFISELLGQYLSEFLKMNVIIVEYPGYSIYNEKKSADLICEDSRIVYKFVKEKFDYFLLVSDDSFAEFDDNRVFGSRCSWPSWTIPHAYFNVAPAKDVYEKPQENNRRRILFDKFDFSGYRAATQEEVYKWLEYEEHIENLHELGEDDLPF